MRRYDRRIDALTSGTFADVEEKVASIMATEDTYFIKKGDWIPEANRFSEYGLSQAGVRCNFPARFVAELQTDGHDSLANDIVYTKMNDTLNRVKNNQLMIREFNSSIYGVLTDKYAIFDDNETVELLKTSDYLMNSEEVWYSVEPEMFHARFISGNKITIPNDPSPLSMCVFVNNSMVGKSALSIKFGIYRWACTNGCISGLKEFTLLKEVHKGKKDFSFMLNDALSEVPKFEEMLFDKVKDMSVTKSSIYNMSDEDAIRYIKEKLVVGGKTADDIITLYKSYGGNTKWDMCNAITDYAHTLNIDDRLRFERLAMKVA